MRRWIGALVVLGLLAAGCGGDDSNGPAAGGSNDVCDAIAQAQRAIDVQTDPDAGLAALQDVVAAGPVSLSEEVVPFVELLAEDPAAAVESDESRTADAAIDRYISAECGDSQIAITARDFAFEGIPAEIASGPVAFTLRNESETGELHEAWIFRRHPGMTDPASDILSRAEFPITGPEGLAPILEVTDPVAIGFTEPPAADAVDVFLVDLEPGDYIVACLLPVDSGTFFASFETGEDISPGPPHFQSGMVAELTVT